MSRLVLALVLPGFVLSACAGSGREVSGDLRNVGAVTVTFKVAPARIKVGQTVRFTFRLVNNAGREEQLTYPSGRRYDFWATLEGKEVWRWSKGRIFVQQITHDEIGSQSGLTFAEPWTPDRAGAYVVHGELSAQGYGRELTGRLTVE